MRAQGRVEDPVDDLDTLVVVGGLGHIQAAEDERLVTHVRRLAGKARRVSSVCTGATVLAAAGLLDDRPATTHWWFAPDLADRYPEGPRRRRPGLPQATRQPGADENATPLCPPNMPLRSAWLRLMTSRIWYLCFRRSHRRFRLAGPLLLTISPRLSASHVPSYRSRQCRFS